MVSSSIDGNLGQSAVGQNVDPNDGGSYVVLTDDAPDINTGASTSSSIAKMNKKNNETNITGEHDQQRQQNSGSINNNNNENNQNNENNNSNENIFARIVTNSNFQVFVITLILLNCIAMGVSTADFVTESEDISEIFHVLDTTFLVVFTVEVSLDFLAYGLAVFKSGWLTFDFLVIAASWTFPKLTVLRGFRALRILSKMRSARSIFYALHSVLPLFGSIVVILFVIFYASSIVFSELFGDMYREGTVSEDYFHGLGNSLFTLFQCMTGAGWPDIAREIMHTYPWAWIPFVTFISVTMFIVVELTIAALCKSISNMEKMGALGDDNDNGNDNMNDGDTNRANKDDGSDYVDRRIRNLALKIDSLATAAGIAPAVESAKLSAENEYNKMQKITPTISSDSDARFSFRDLMNKDGVEWYAFPAQQSTIKTGTFHGVVPDSFQKRCQLIAENGLFQVVIIASILINGVMMGLATYDFVKDNENIDSVFDAFDYGFLVLFTLELLIQFGYRASAFFESGWLIFDLLVIVLSWIVPKFQAVRALRCLILFSHVYFMRAIMNALALVSPKICIVASLLILLNYIMGVIFTDMFKDLYSNGLTSEDYFGSIGKTMFSLFQCMTIAGWPDIAREVMKTYNWAWVPFIVWIVLSKFTLVQLVIAVLCQSLAHIDVSVDKKGGNESGISGGGNGDGDGVKAPIDDITRLESKIDMLMRNASAQQSNCEKPPQTKLAPVEGSLV